MEINLMRDSKKWNIDQQQKQEKAINRELEVQKCVNLIKNSTF